MGVGLAYYYCLLFTTLSLMGPTAISPTEYRRSDRKVEDTNQKRMRVGLPLLEVLWHEAKDEIGSPNHYYRKQNFPDFLLLSGEIGPFEKGSILFQMEQTLPLRLLPKLRTLRFCE